MDWKETNSYLKGTINNLNCLYVPVRIAAFDLDDTLIHRSSGKTGSNKWKLLDSEIVPKLTVFLKDNFILTIFTNQAGMSGKNTSTKAGKTNFDKISWRKAMDDLIKILTSGVKNYYVAVYVAKKYDFYRKPNLGMWNQMKTDLITEFGLEKLLISKRSFYCGDAAGRTTASPFKKKLYPSTKTGDFADTDRKFALNIKINFITPEEFLLDNPEEMQYKLSGVNPKELIKTATEPTYFFTPRKKEMIIMIGEPGSGKTEFVNNYILPHKYVYINRDTCKTKKKCIEQTKKALDAKKSIVIDNTNPDVFSRMDYTSLAVENNYSHIRAIIMVTPPEIVKHMNNVRHIHSAGEVPKINEIVYNKFKKNYVKPSKSEHFDKIEKVNFVLDSKYFEDPEFKRAFMKWS